MKTKMKLIDWLRKSVPWYHIWDPRSGFVGGVAVALLGTAVLILWHMVASWIMN